MVGSNSSDDSSSSEDDETSLPGFTIVDDGSHKGFSSVDIVQMDNDDRRVGLFKDVGDVSQLCCNEGMEMAETGLGD